MPSVLQDWVTRLPLREQGTLLTGVRGCDLTPKVPHNSTERQLVGFLRYCIMNPADKREVDVPGAFFQSFPPPTWKSSELGHYPLHWVSHLMHCFEVIAFRCPNRDLAQWAMEIYMKIVRCLHLNPESSDQMIKRLSEDRIANNTVVS